MLFSNAEIDNICPDSIPLDQPLWARKHSLKELQVLQEGDKYTFASQSQQNPRPYGGLMFKDKYWKHYDLLPSDIDVWRIYGDTAQKVQEQNDYSVFQFWARSPSSGIYLVDQIRGKWEAPQLESMLVEFWNKHKPNQYKPFGAQLVKVEDKSSGSSLIQSIKQNYLIPIEGIPRNKDKVFRAMGVVKYFDAGYIHLPKNVPWVSDYKDEFMKFSPLMTHKFDDQIDPTMDAVEDLLVFGDQLYSKHSM